MLPDLLGALAAALRRLARRWPRQLVLRHGGEPVCLVHVIEGPDGRLCVVEEVTGATRLVPPEALESRPVLVPEAVLVHLALALAASVATLAVLTGR